MRSLEMLSSRRERAAALIIVLAFVVLLTVLAIAYFSRTTSDRPVAQSSFNQSKVDQLAASAMDNIIGDLRQEIINGSTATTVNGVTIYAPTSAANMVPQRSGNAAGVPNLIRRSVSPDNILAPGLPSHASAVNSTTNPSANGRSVTSTRWNSHYLVPKKNTGSDDSIPIDAFTAATPDWVFVTNQGATVITAPNTSVIGRYAYAIYDEGGLLDMNVVGYPTGTTTVQSGRKGSVAFADLTALPYPILNPTSGSPSTYQIDMLVGWRNYATTLPSNNFPDVLPSGQVFAKNFQTDSTRAAAYYSSILGNTTGFLSPSGTPAPNDRTDQMFLSRQQLIAFRNTPVSNSGTPINGTAQFYSNTLQYLGTFLRELNAPSWTPTYNAGDPAIGGNNGAGNVYAYKGKADSSTAINRNLLNVRVTNSFTRADGTAAVVGEPLIKRRFPLTRLNGLGPTGVTSGNSTVISGVLSPASAATVQRDFGLIWDGTNKRWNYVGATGSTVQTAIERLDQVASENREPNFFELLKAVILNGSVGLGSGSANTFVTSEAKYYNTAAGFSSDHQIMQIGANIIDQWDADNVPTFIAFQDPTTSTIYELAGIENLPYLNKLVFKPAWIKVSGKDQFAAWLLPSLSNPHQNAPGTGNVRIVMPTATQSMTGYITYTGGVTPYASTAIAGSSTQYMTVDASGFGTTSPSAPTAVVNTGAGSSITKSPDNYYGFHFAFATNVAVTPSNSLTAYPDFGAAGCDLEMQVLVAGTTWKPYQRWKGCGPLHPLVFQPPATSYWSQTNLQDPEFVTLDPRTVRFGAWGNAGNQSGATLDFTNGTQFTLDSPPVEAITSKPPQGTSFNSSTSPNLYLYANNADPSVHYTDLDQVQRRGDPVSVGQIDEMQLTNSADRPRMLNGFQSVADLGQVFRDQPWKTLNFTDAVSGAAANSADAGLLDVFGLHECAMEAGKSSLNTRQAPVLTAILSQATKRLTGANVITPAERDNIITALQNLTAAQPMVNKAELVTRLAADPSVTSLGNKEARECVIRAFSDASQTRTWNLMIDVIGQSGKYKPNAQSLANDFIVEGEQHYWVHVAIDRFTGQVIDRQIEVVKE